MKNSSIITLLLLVVFSLAKAQTPVFIDSTYKLVFNDEFEGNKLDRNTWDIKFPWNQSANDQTIVCGYGTDNPQYGQKAYRQWRNDTNNVKVSGGTVKLIVKKESYNGEFWDWVKNANGQDSLVVTHHDVDYTSGMLFSNKQYYRGYYEIRFKLPKQPGFLGSYQPFGANFWMYTGGCYSEIDGFEIVDGQSREYTSNMHYIIPPTGVDGDTECAQLWGPKHKQDFHTYGSISPNEWHTGGFNWTEDRIDYYLDGENIYSSTIGCIDSLKPMPMIVDINAPKENCSSLESVFTKFPYVFEVDYIKIWQPGRKED